VSLAGVAVAGSSKAKYFRSEREAMRRVLEFNVISIIDLDLGNRSVTNDIENVLRKIEYYHQGSIAAFHIMYRDSERIWDGINWDGKRASFFALCEIEEGQARKRLLERI